MEDIDEIPNKGFCAGECIFITVVIYLCLFPSPFPNKRICVRLMTNDSRYL